MLQRFDPTNRPVAQRRAIRGEIMRVLLVCLVLLPSGLPAEPQVEEILDITGRYQFLGPDDTLAILEEDGRLKGYVDVFQGEEESDVVLSYPITLGSRRQNRIEFKTGKIHQMYYRFTGSIERGSGRQPRDRDHLRFVGELEIITVNGETGAESSQRLNVVFKSLGKEAGGEE